MANEQLTARVAPDFVARIEAVRDAYNTRPEHRAMPLDRTDAVRLLLGKGLDVVEHELGLAPEAPPASAASAPRRGRRSARR